MTNQYNYLKRTIKNFILNPNISLLIKSWLIHILVWSWSELIITNYFTLVWIEWVWSNSSIWISFLCLCIIVVIDRMANIYVDRILLGSLIRLNTLQKTKKTKAKTKFNYSITNSDTNTNNTISSESDKHTKYKTDLNHINNPDDTSEIELNTEYDDSYNDDEIELDAEDYNYEQHDENTYYPEDQQNTNDNTYDNTDTTEPEYITDDNDDDYEGDLKTDYDIYNYFYLYTFIWVLFGFPPFLLFLLKFYITLYMIKAGLIIYLWFIFLITNIIITGALCRIITIGFTKLKFTKY